MAFISKKECINSFVNALRENNAAIFAGAGFSKDAGYVDWKELMRDVASDLGLDIDSESDLIAIAQYHINERLGNRDVINKSIIEHFTKNAKITDSHRILANLPISTYWTTNYDRLIEQSLIEAGKTPDVKIISENLCITKPKRDAIVYKMHGDALFPNDAVLTKEDYETYEFSRSSYSIVLQADLVSKTFLFIGFSFEDPNLIYILTRIKNLLGNKVSRNHYCIFKRETDPLKFRKQELRLNDLNRYGIFAVVVDDYPDIKHELLEPINKYYKRSQIFISGAAEVFDEYGSENAAIEFIHLLSKSFLENEKKIISGFGYKVGSAVINGALEYIFSVNFRNIDDYLKLMPFPQITPVEERAMTVEDRKASKRFRNKRYREMMLSEAGVAVFMFGNKLDNDGKTIINSNGMIEEFQIAKEKGLKLIPIGATGYTARELWNDIMKNFDDYYGNDLEIKEWFRILGDVNNPSNVLIETTNKIIEKINIF